MFARPTAHRELEPVFLAVDPTRQDLDLGRNTLEVERFATLEKLLPTNILSELWIERLTERGVDKCLQGKRIFFRNQKRRRHLPPGAPGAVYFTDKKRRRTVELLARDPFPTRQHPSLFRMWYQHPASLTRILGRVGFAVLPGHPGPLEFLHVVALRTRDMIPTLVALEIPGLDLAPFKGRRTTDVYFPIIKRFRSCDC